MRKLSYVGLTALVGGIVLAGLTARSASAADKDGKWVTVKGQVVFAGANLPARPKLNVTKDQDHCLSKGPVLGEELVVNPDSKGVKNVFVWITDANGGKPPIAPDLAKPPAKPVELDQPVCAFIPHAMAVREGHAG